MNRRSARASKFFQFATVVAASVGLVCSAAAQRESIQLDSGWRFIRQDVALTNVVFSWDKVNVPHTWNAEDGRPDRSKRSAAKEGYYRGTCWYERNLKAPEKWRGKRVFIRFEAAALVANVYFNGQLLGEHRGGFTAFCYELTKYLKFGQPNELRVQVDNSSQADVPPLTGDFNINGGLYRPVHLIVTDEVCITPLDFASPGVYLTTKSLDVGRATVEVKSLVSNGGGVEMDVALEAAIKDARGKSVARLSSRLKIGGRRTEPAIETLTIDNPHLWSGCPDPYLYTVTVRVRRGGKMVDEVSQPLGLRTLAISQAEGFLLNGKPYPIHGVNRHQDYFKKGWAISEADQDQDMQIMLDMGVNAVRLAHYPQSDYMNQLCDRKGLLAWEEVSLVNGIPDSRAFDANAEQQLREMILQRYNHPSVTFWGTFNEIGNKKTAPPDALLKRLKAIINEMDPNRIDVGASCYSPRSFNHIPTAISFNQYPGWYGNGMPTDFSQYIDARYTEVGKRIAISEYGAGGNPFQHQEGPPQRVEWKSQFHPEDWQSYTHEVEWAAIQNNPKLWGSFLWAMFEFPSADRDEGGHVGLNDKGLVTWNRLVRKDAYYFYKANWNPGPMVYIASRRSTPRRVATTEVKVYSNCAEVELNVNGKSLGTSKPDTIKVARWTEVNLKPGKNLIKAVGRIDGKTIADSCEWTLTADN